MKQIRNCVFETNSSSTHSITLKSKNKYVKPFGVDDLKICFGEYGWEQEQYSYPEDKLSYVLTMIQYHLNFKWDSKEMKNDSIVNTILESKYFKWLKELVLDYTGRNLIVSNEEVGSWSPAGYIDHQSTDILDDWWSDDEMEFKKNMKEFIFNEKYGFMTDNDNH